MKQTKWEETADFPSAVELTEFILPTTFALFYFFLSVCSSLPVAHVCVSILDISGGGGAPWLHFVFSCQLVTLMADYTLSRSRPAGRPAVKSSGSNMLLGLHTGDSRPPQWAHHCGHNIWWFCWYRTKYQWSRGVFFTWTWGRCCWRPWCSSGVSPKLDPLVSEKHRCSSFISE